MSSSGMHPRSSRPERIRSVRYIQSSSERRPTRSAKSSSSAAMWLETGGSIEWNSCPDSGRGFRLFRRQFRGLQIYLIEFNAWFVHSGGGGYKNVRLPRSYDPKGVCPPALCSGLKFSRRGDTFRSTPSVSMIAAVIGGKSSLRSASPLCHTVVYNRHDENGMDVFIESGNRGPLKGERGSPVKGRRGGQPETWRCRAANPPRS